MRESVQSRLILTADHAHAGHRLRNYSSQSNVYWNQLMAAAIVVSAPVVIAFVALQRYIVRGLTAGGVK
jgi:multiple sugar transport system permease protein